VIPRQLYVGTIDVTPAEQAVTDFAGFPLAVYPAAPLLFRCWQLRDNLIAYDACSSALAESLECRLLTADTRRSRALGEVLVLVRDWVIGALDRFGRSRSVSRNSSGWTAGDR